MQGDHEEKTVKNLIHHTVIMLLVAAPMYHITQSIYTQSKQLVLLTSDSIVFDHNITE